MTSLAAALHLIVLIVCPLEKSWQTFAMLLLIPVDRNLTE
jgi:hypothetical protein